MLEERTPLLQGQEERDALEGIHRVPEKHSAGPEESTLAVREWNVVPGARRRGSETFLAYVRSQRQDNQGVSPLLKGNKLRSDPATKAGILSQQLCSVFTVDEPDTANISLEGPSYPPHDQLHVTEAGVHKLLKNLNPGKASGPDEIPTRLLKELADDIAPVVTSIIRQTLNQGRLPDVWRDAWVTPVFKKGGRSDPANYRPVSLTCIVCKLAEHILCSHIRGHLDDKGILTPANHGFRKDHSCESQLLLTTHELLKHRDAKRQVDIGILDFSKAFDTVPHKRLLNKLRLYGIHGSVFRWIESFLTNRRQLVVCDGTKSEYSPVTSGVPQGTVLGPLLFLLYINDMPSVVDSGTSVRLFADDALVYRVINNIEDQEVLQQDLIRLETWAKSWGMIFNPSKCYMMHIGRGRNILTHMYQLCGTILGSVTSEKYLGVYLTHDLKWDHHINQVTTKAARKLGFSRRNLRGAPAECKKLAYIALVRSGMEYASIIWDPHTNTNSDKLEKIQRSAARWVLSSYSRTTSVTSLLEQLKLEPLQTRRRIQRLAFIYKILNGQVAVPMADLDLKFNKRPIRGKATNTKRLETLRSNTNEYKFSFATRTIKEWNAIPQTVASADSAASLRSRLSKHPGP